MRVARFLLGVAIVVGSATTAGAQAIVYNNGGPNDVSGNEMSAFNQAEDFTFGSMTSFDGIRFWDIEVTGAFSGNGIQWSIFADAAGPSGSALFSGNANPTRVAQGTASCCGFDRYQNDLSISPVTLGAGTYWLVLHEGADFDRRDFYWETTNPNGTHTGMEQFGGSGSYDDNFDEHAFALTVTTPEPASLGLLATGLLGIVGTLRRRKR